MIFTETPLQGVFVVELNPINDERGFFARAFCAKEFTQHDMSPVVKQANISINFRKGTLRGLHYQLPPAAETKFIRCIKGAIYDVVVDLRQESTTYLKHFAIELTEENRTAPRKTPTSPLERARAAARKLLGRDRDKPKKDDPNIYPLF